MLFGVAARQRITYLGLQRILLALEIGLAFFVLLPQLAYQLLRLLRLFGSKLLLLFRLRGLFKSKSLRTWLDHSSLSSIRATNLWRNSVWIGI